jgi:hypothetical protein
LQTRRLLPLILAQSILRRTSKLTGWRGVMERERRSPSPAEFPSLSGAVFPVYHVLADLAGGGFYAPARISAPGRMVSQCVSSSSRRSVR